MMIGLILLLSTAGLSARVQLSNEAKISLLTCSPGEELYSVFGHSALRVCDPSNQLDLVFNYGTFDFNTSYFYFKFGHGNLNYMLSVGQFQHFLPGYVIENRSMTESVLNLKPDERQKLFDALLVNAQPQNRDYRYDFFYDNCATRIRDMVVASIDGKVIIPEHSSHNLTMRQLYGQYLKRSLWTQFGIHLLLGMKSDVASTPYTEMYLPDYLDAQFDNMRIVRTDSLPTQLVASKVVLLEKEPQPIVTDLWSPRLVLGIFMVLIILISLMEWKMKWNLIAFDRFLFLVTGLLGCLLAYLCFISKHTATTWNFNLLWAMPTLLLLTFTAKNTQLFKILAFASFIGTILFIAGFELIPQEFPRGIFFLVSGLAIRFGMNSVYEKYFKK